MTVSIEELEKRQKANQARFQEIADLKGQVNPMSVVEIRLNLLVEMLLGPLQEDNQNRIAYEMFFEQNISQFLLHVKSEVQKARMGKLIVPKFK